MADPISAWSSTILRHRRTQTGFASSPDRKRPHSAELRVSHAGDSRAKPVRSMLPASATACLEVIDQPTAGRARWRVGAIYRAHRHQRLQVAWQFDSNSAEFPAGDVVFTHEAWHVSEAEAGTQKSVPRTHVGEPPGVLREHAVVLAL